MNSKTAVVTLAAALAAACLAWPAAGANSGGFTDPAGDSGTAPDVTNVSVSNDDTGRITFQITVANRPALASTDLLLVAMDTDGNLSDGVGGLDYAVGMTVGGTLVLSGASGSLVVASAPSLTSSFSGGVATIAVNRSDLGNPSQLNFLVGASGDSAATTGDMAPDGGFSNYQVLVSAVAPPPPPPAPAPPPPPPATPLSLASGKLTVGKARAGRPFVVSLVVRRGDTGELLDGGQVSCAGRVGKSPLRPAAKAQATGGLASCSWMIPVKAHGKTISGSITVTYKGVKVTKAFSARIL
jgi:hypothetical protein